jgi:hypothetical protein
MFPRRRWTRAKYRLEAYATIPLSKINDNWQAPRMGRAPARSGVACLDAIFATALRIRARSGDVCLFYLYWTCEPGSRGSVASRNAVSKPALMRIRPSVIPKAQSPLRAECIVPCRPSRPFRLSNACNAMALTRAHLESRPSSDTHGPCQFRLPGKRLRAGAEYPTFSPVKSICSPQADGSPYRVSLWGPLQA